MIRGWKRLVRLAAHTGGATTLEFAFVAPVLIVLAVGAMEVGEVMIATSLLEGGLRAASRYGATGQSPTSGTRSAELARIINEKGVGLFTVTAADITTLIYPNFTMVGKPEPFTDTNANSVYDTGEPFTDINCNAAWDSDMGRAGLGSGGEVVLYRVRYDLPLIMGILPSAVGLKGTFPISAAVSVRNEPFSQGGPPCLAASG